MQNNFKSQNLPQFFDALAPQREYWIKKNAYYYLELYKLHQWLIPKHKKILEIGTGTGNLLHQLNPKKGVGIDISYEMVKIAAQKYPSYTFKVMDAHNLEFNETFDYVILSNLVGYVDDIWQVFRNLQKVSHKNTRIIITNYNYLWQPMFTLAEKLKFKMPDRIQNWLPQDFIKHFLYLNGFKTLKQGKYLHTPIDLGYISDGLNPLLATMPFVSNVGLIEYIVAAPVFLHEKPASSTAVSIIVPTHKEAGNIGQIVDLMPPIGKSTELIFVDLPGNDGTEGAIKQAIKTYKGKLKISYIKQTEKTGKIGALRLGVKSAKGEIILIFDADLTVPPQDLQKFYVALTENRGDLINGTRLVYPTEKGAMRFINHIGNSIFAHLFSWALGQHFTDTLCGSKGFWKSDFEEFERSKTSVDRIDRYGDFYLLLGGYRRNLAIVEVPVRYKMRRYGDTKINRIRNGWQFLRMFVYFFWNYKLLRRKEF